MANAYVENDHWELPIYLTNVSMTVHVSVGQCKICIIYRGHPLPYCVEKTSLAEDAHEWLTK
jgi:hypothetical protein